MNKNDKQISDVAANELAHPKPNYEELRTAYVNCVGEYLGNLKKAFALQPDSQSSVDEHVDLKELLNILNKDKRLSNTQLPELIVGFRKMAEAHLQVLDQIHEQALSTVNADMTKTEEILSQSISRITRPLDMTITLLGGNVELFQQMGLVDTDSAKYAIESKVKENSSYLAVGIKSIAEEIKRLSEPMVNIGVVALSDKTTANQKLSC